MKTIAGFWLAAILVLPALAADKITQVVIDGAAYQNIQDAHIVSGGRIVILFPGGGTTVTADKLSRAFLDSWGITAESLETSKKEFARQSADALTQAIRAGLFREVDGVVFDLRKAQPAWVQFSNAKVLQVVGDGALLDPTPNLPNHPAVLVRNVPANVADNDTINIMAKVTGVFSYVNHAGIERTIRSYDAGRPCQREEIPGAMLKDGLASAALPFAARPKEHAESAPTGDLPDRGKLRAVGSGFFISDDGYLITNYHVVEEAHKVKVKYRAGLLEAEIIEVDRVNDLALLKVPGRFKPLPLAREALAELGEEVFTIGFPNIDVQGLEPKYTDGKISSLAGVQDDPTEYQISVPVQPGNSGGPLCNSRGEVVGIVVARLSDMAVLRSSGSLPQNVNYAVKAKYAISLAQKRQISILPRINPSEKLDGVVQNVEDSIAMILIY